MEAMQLTSKASCDLFRAFPKNRAPPRTLVVGRNNPVEIARDSRADLANDSRKWREESGENLEACNEQAKDKAYDMKDRTKENARHKA
ncbi:unnamed protein product [Eruca vesicaria subsp. sativa]|uniref:Uncharacterized protein n=1 Tax=Eruca vesicaria subsp. sativa TaxID=29727 RepID=A0ABC8LTH4_ERUVS|nr:unnamed protein product [Eruca vesicaria subsp. sativa]